ncbi:MAG: gluconate 2-dehydrogenase subunit 3 family protein [Burkholderiaceae bacterium]
MTERFPGYDVLAKRDGPSWNAQTRRVIDRRLATDPGRHDFLDDAAWATLRALCERIVPQPPTRPGRIPVAALVDARLQEGAPEGYRDARLPPLREAWRRGLAALDAEAQAQAGVRFHAMAADAQDSLLRRVQHGQAYSPAWDGMPPELFFRKRVLHDIVAAYYGHPTAWSEIGFGGPASPRGYVRLDFDRRDPWEASEARPGREDEARRENDRVR